MKEIMIASAVRTPIGRLGGSLSSLPATALGSIVVAEAVRRAGIEGESVEEVILGNVLSAGEGQAPARQAALKGGLPQSAATVTINKVCGSGLFAVMLAARGIAAGDAGVVVAGGMESMSNAPYLLMKARGGYRMGHDELVDSLIKDGLWDVYNNFHMGEAAELCAETLKITREDQDRHAAESYRRALKAQEQGDFRPEIIPVPVILKGETRQVEEDEGPRFVQFERLSSLKPVFREKGTVTAANASSISDGASALVLLSGGALRKTGLQPLARIVGYTTYATKPAWFTTAPVYAISSLLKKTGCRLSDVDLFEINEAFSASSIAVNLQLGLDPEKVNVRGGAVALGHPIGASGARILTTLIYAMKSLNKRRGIASLCIGGGEAVALMVERAA